MTEQVVVLGSGYAGAGAIKSLEAALDGEASITWISEQDYHLVLHESHRCIADPSVGEKITFPVTEIKSPETDFIEAHVTGVDTDDRTVHLDEHEEVDYDYLLVGLGSQTAYFGIEGLRKHAHTLKGLDDACGIHDALAEATAEATPDDPARVVVGGAGLSGIQAAGEIAAYRDEQDAPIAVMLIEGLDEVLPNGAPSVQTALRDRLEDRDVMIVTGEFVGEVDDDTVYVGEDGSYPYDVLVWTGGITGQDAVAEAAVEQDKRSHRLKAGQTFQTDDERIFAIGDAAIVDQPGEEPAPPTAQAAWQAAEVAGTNIARAVRDEPLKEWTFKDKGTVISVGHDAVAHDVSIVPLVDTFGGLPAKFLKKAIAARWIRTVAGTRAAIRAWPDM